MLRMERHPGGMGVVVRCVRGPGEQAKTNTPPFNNGTGDEELTGQVSQGWSE
jgi:hypothetical protein